MDFISRYLAQIRAQLLGLTVSQKLLIGTLLVIMAVTVYFCVQWSAKPEMVELLPTSSTPEEVAAMTSYLKSAHYTYTAANDKIMVPAEQAYAIRGELAAAQVLPKDTTAAFGKLADANEWMLTNASIDRRWNYARQEVLTKIIRNFPYISDATVIISQGQREGLGRDMIPSSASVSVKLKHGEGLSTNQLLAIVDTIRGSVSGLKREDVHVTDGSRSYTAPSEDLPMPADLLAYKTAIEDQLAHKLIAQFGSIGDVKIAVNVIPEMAARKTQETIFDPKGVAKATTRETSTDTNTTDGATPSGQPGVGSNVAVSPVTTSSANHAMSTSSNTTSETMVKFSEKTVIATSPPGTEMKKMTASISLPRSYFVRIFQRVKKDPKADPEDKELTETIKESCARIHDLAMNAIGAETTEQIRVDWFDDLAAGGPGAEGHGGTATVASAGSAPSIGVLINQFGKQAVLGAFALVALATMLMMVRRAAPNTAGSDADPGVFVGDYRGAKRSKAGKTVRRMSETDTLEIDDDVLGEANQSEAVLTGIELDDETLQSRKMVDEVSTMVKENPENAAAMVKRWLAKGK